MAGPRPTRRPAIAAALFAITLAAFSGLLHADFINFDDDAYVTANRHVRAGLTAPSIGWAFTSTDAANWHPLTWLSHLTDVQMSGLDAGRHHATSVVLHAIDTVLLFLVLSVVTGAVFRPALVALLFGLHPLHVESVAWISERKDVLSTLFWLLTLWLWLRWVASKTPARYALVGLAYACGLMAKPMLVTLPFTLLLLDVWPLGRIAWRPLWIEKLPLFAMAALSAGVTAVVQRAGGAVGSFQAFPFGERLGNAIVAYAAYLSKTIRPVGLAAFYPYPHDGPSAASVAIAAAVLAAITALVLRYRTRAPYLLVGWLWYLGTLVPVIGLVQIGSQSMADRYTYVPLIGIFIIVSWGLADLTAAHPSARRVVVAAALCVAAVLFTLTRAQAATWRDSATLFRHALRVTDDNWLAHANLGAALLGENRFDEVIEHEREALRIRPAYPEAHCNLGLALVRTGRQAEAATEFEQALALRPTYAIAHNNLAGILAGQHRFDEAIDHLEQALRSDPGNVEARANLASLLMAKGRWTEAAAQLEAVLALQPNDAGARRDLQRIRQALRNPS